MSPTIYANHVNQHTSRHMNIRMLVMVRSEHLVLSCAMYSLSDRKAAPR